MNACCVFCVNILVEGVFFCVQTSELLSFLLSMCSLYQVLLALCFCSRYLDNHEKIEKLLAQIMELESEKQKSHEQFSAQRGQLKNLFLQKEGIILDKPFSSTFPFFMF